MKIIATLILFVPLVCISQSNEQIAEKYLEAYQNLDFAAMSNYYADDAEFIDPTFHVMDPKGFHIKGKEVIKSTLEKGFEGTIKWQLDFKVKFSTGDFVVVAGNIISSSKGEVWGRPDKKEVNFNHPFVTILQFKNGKIIEHRDYIDYVTAGAQLQRQ